MSNPQLELRCDKEEDQWFVWHLLHWGMCILVHEALALPAALWHDSLLSWVFVNRMRLPAIVLTSTGSLLADTTCSTSESE